ncbi:MAG: molecular chaperone TorD family protein [Planctomycetota bacterium]|nr:molecular chaperone TorD family protein [Planctomycetota bacterium]MDA1250291.1 molecular chaperone TorD family protein [Planctomycetota bacterium]
MSDAEFRTLGSSTEDLAARAGVYELLSRLWLYEVDAELLSELTDGLLAAAWSELGGPSIEASQLEDLATEYCRLFVGPRDQVAPFQSVWETGQHGGQAVASMRECLELLSEPVAKLEEIPDHLGVQLLLMGVFLRCLAGDPDSEDLQDVVEGFAEEHLRWPAEMLDAATAKSEMPFYRFLIAATRQFLAGEHKLLAPES